MKRMSFSGLDVSIAFPQAFDGRFHLKVLCRKLLSQFGSFPHWNKTRCSSFPGDLVYVARRGQEQPIAGAFTAI